MLQRKNAGGATAKTDYVRTLPHYGSRGEYMIKQIQRLSCFWLKCEKIWKQNRIIVK